MASANYPVLHIKDFKQRYNLQTNILLSDKGNFKAALDMFYTAMIVNVIFLYWRQFSEPWNCDLSIGFP